MYLAKRRKDKRLAPITIVCQFHCKIFVAHKSVTTDTTVYLSRVGFLIQLSIVFHILNVRMSQREQARENSLHDELRQIPSALQKQYQFSL